MAKASSESDIQKACINALGWCSDHVMGWRNNCGRARIGGRYIQFGHVGQGDFTGTIGPHGTRLEMEFKTKTGKQSKEQEAFQKKIEDANGVYLLVRSVYDMEEQIHAVLRERFGVVL